MEFKNLYFKYEDGTKVFSNLSCRFDQGAIIGVIGANGSGKSTLFSLMMGLLKPQKGEVTYEGSPLDYSKKGLRKHRQSVTMVLQDSEKQLFHSTVADDVAFTLRNLRYPLEEINRKVEQALEAVGALGFCHKPIHFLSYGQKKRVAIAGALVTDAKVMLLDEPTSGLDPAMIGQMKVLLRDLAKDRRLIISSHDMDFIYDLCDYVMVLDRGCIVVEGTAETVFMQESLLQQAQLSAPWLVKAHRFFGVPLYRCESDVPIEDRKESS